MYRGLPWLPILIGAAVIVILNGGCAIVAKEVINEVPKIELLINSNFELFDEDGVPTGWNMRSITTMGEHAMVDVGAGPEGQNVLVIIDDGATRSYGIETILIEITPGSKYRASVWGRSEPGSRTRIWLRYYDENDEQIASYTTTVGTTTEWRLAHVEEEAPDNAATARIILDTRTDNVGTSYLHSPSLQLAD